MKGIIREKAKAQQGTRNDLNILQKSEKSHADSKPTTPIHTDEELSKMAGVSRSTIRQAETIIDGHNRWAIIQAHPDIPYTIDNMDFPDRYAAIVWICQNQLGKRNLTNEQKTYLIGKQYEAQRQTHGASDGFRGNQFTTNLVTDQSGHLPKETARQRVARQAGVGEGTVQRAEHFAKGLDAADAVSPGFKDSVLTGEVKAPKTVIAALPQMDEPERKKTIQAKARANCAAGGGDQKSGLQKSEKVDAPSAATINLGGKTMFYVKTKLSAGATMTTEITEENTFAVCPDCGQEHTVDLSEIFATGEADLYSTQVFCAECSKRRQGGNDCGGN